MLFSNCLISLHFVCPRRYFKCWIGSWMWLCDLYFFLWSLVISIVKMSTNCRWIIYSNNINMSVTFFGLWWYRRSTTRILTERRKMSRYFCDPWTIAMFDVTSSSDLAGNRIVVSQLLDCLDFVAVLYLTTLNHLIVGFKETSEKNALPNIKNAQYILSCRVDIKWH